MKYFTLLLLLLFTAWVQAQNYSLAYFKGAIEVSTGNSWSPLKQIGATVNNKQSVRVKEKSEAVFTGTDGETVHLKKAGTYKVTDLKKYVVSSDQSSLTGYYLNSIAHQMTHKDANPEKDYAKQLKNLGGVSRGKSCLVAPVNATYIIDSTITLVWHNLNSDSYTVGLYEYADGKSLAADWQTRDTFISFNRIKKNLAAGKTYYWDARGSTSRPCDKFAFTILSQEEQTKVTAELNKMESQADLTGALKQAVLGKFYESKGLYENARTCYIKARILEPDNEAIQQLHIDFEAGISVK